MNLWMGSWIWPICALFIPWVLAKLPSHQTTKRMESIGIEQKLGATIPNVKLIDETGKPVFWKDLASEGKPILLSLVYYACPGLCNYHLNGLVEGLKGLEWEIGEKFQIVTVSFDSSETPKLARAKKKTYVDLYGRSFDKESWRFLTGSKENIAKLTQAVGFGFSWDEESFQWAHASAAVFISAKNRIVRYLPGIMFYPKDLKLALVEAGEGRIGSVVDQIQLFCYQFDPTSSRYTLVAAQLMRLGGALTILFLGLLFLWLWKGRRVA